MKLTQPNFETSFSEFSNVLTPKQIKRLERQAKRQMRTENRHNVHQLVNKSAPPQRHTKPLVAKTEKQKDLIRSIIECEQTIVIGSAGTGKTYIAAAMAADMLIKGEIRKIILTRPNVPAGRSIGFLPGTLEEKMAPWMAPITEVLKERMGVAAYECNVKNGNIEIVPFEVIRGRTFNNSFVILDEAQNTLVTEAKAFLTRIGSDCKVVINGDVKQTDIDKDSGLAMIIRMLKKHQNLKDRINMVEFTIDDCVRSDIVKEWLTVFDKENIQ